jgi:hypothetical protein
MWSRCVLAFALASHSFHPLAAAPAPFPHPNRNTPAEVVFAAGTPGRTEMALSYLRSSLFRDRLLASKTVRELGCLQGVSDRRAWLAARLKVESGKGSLVQVRVTGCRLAEGLAVLQATVDSVATPVKRASVDGEQLQRVKLREALLVQRLVILEREGAISSEERERIQLREAEIHLRTRPLEVKRQPGRAPR